MSATSTPPAAAASHPFTPFCGRTAIAPNYLSTDADRKVAADSLRVGGAHGAAGQRPHQPQEHKPGAQYQSDADPGASGWRYRHHHFHPVGTTKMGRDDDPRLWSMRAQMCAAWRPARVVDAGVMPLITSGNTNSPHAHDCRKKAAQWIMEDAHVNEGLIPMCAAQSCVQYAHSG